MKLIYLPLLLLSFIGSAQNTEINWGESIQTNGDVQQMEHLNSEDVFGISLVTKGKIVYKENHFAIHFSNGQITEEIALENQEKTVDYYKGSFVLGENLTVCGIKNRDGKKVLLAQSYSKTLKNLNGEVELASYGSEENWSDDRYIIVPSENKEYFALLWHCATDESGTIQFRTMVYNKNFEVIDNSEFDLSFLENAQIKSIMLSNYGELYIATSDQLSAYGNPPRNDYSLNLHKLKEDQMETVNVDFGSKQLNEVEIIANTESKIDVVGSYGESNYSIRGTKGVFFLRADFVKNSLTEEKFHSFEQSFIVSNQSKQEKENEILYGRKFGEVSPQFGSYGVLKIEQMPDGSTYGFIEQSWKITYESGVSSYLHENLLVFNISENGDLVWKVVVPKRQVTGIDKGSISSYFNYCTDDDVKVVFNDIEKNYSKNGDYLGGDLAQAGLSVDKNIAIIVSINKENGEVSREFFDKNSSKRIIIPSFCYADYSKGKLLFYSVNYSSNKDRKCQFGVLKL